MARPKLPTRKTARKTARQETDVRFADSDYSLPPSRRNRQPLEGKTAAQDRYINAMQNFTCVIATGPAGTGKTFCSAALAAELMEAGEIDQIIITRPAVEAGESLGFLPGEIEEKFDPYLQPFRDVFNKVLGPSKAEYMIKSGKIETRPLAYMRGSTFDRAFIILDEAQNTTPAQMKMFLTRIGEDCTVVVNGDTAQSDIRGENGLDAAVKKLAWIPQLKVIEFSVSDIVRSGFVQDVVSSWDNK